MPESVASDQTQALEPHSNLRRHGNDSFTTKPSFNEIAPEILLHIYHLFLPPRTPPFGTTDFKILPPADSPDRIDLSYTQHYPITLHINRESRYETLKAYMLVMRDISQFRQQIHITLRHIPWPKRRITTWWCFDPANDIVQIPHCNSTRYIVEAVSLNPGFLDNIKHAEWVEEGPSLAFPAHHALGNGGFSYFSTLYIEKKFESIEYLARLQGIETFTFFVTDPNAADPNHDQNTPDDVYRKPIWIAGATFYVFFAGLAKMDPVRTIPKTILKTPNTTIPFVVDPDVSVQEKLPGDAYDRSDLKIRHLFDWLAQKVLEEFKKVWFARTSEDIVTTWKDAEMGVVDKLTWDSYYVRTRKHMRTE
ncbi:hypothetical protein HYALB_00007242 [Hymenoscyphus albidus]|uniref:2EXR domain-containing protein n=1 Tax=Hymenoscyphus albidus TaxID=595503 RepID=A0A9N9PXI6_9HELO|nr:hypothetical protein HYALB_00007242 [Hymenoscyphus albidus]